MKLPAIARIPLVVLLLAACSLAPATQPTVSPEPAATAAVTPPATPTERPTRSPASVPTEYGAEVPPVATLSAGDVSAA